jgi:hypothetical protein
MVKKNIGSVDRLIRVVLGAALIIVGVVLRSWWGAIGLIPLVTGLSGFCPLYALLRTSTNRHSGA